jgi:hypothetical protein
MRLASLKKPLDLKVIQGATGEWRAVVERQQVRSGNQTVAFAASWLSLEILSPHAVPLSI